jgi:hypothetical protein
MKKADKHGKYFTAEDAEVAKVQRKGFIKLKGLEMA